MIRALFAALLTLAVVTLTSVAQDAPTRRANRVIHAQEKELLNRITQRVEWDKQLTGSTMQLEVQPGGAVLLKGSVMTEAAKARAVDLVESTTGVVSVTDELAVVKNVKVIDARSSSGRASEATQSASVPAESKLIVRP